MEYTIKKTLPDPEDKKSFSTVLWGFCGAVLIYAVFCFMQFSCGAVINQAGESLRSAYNGDFCTLLSQNSSGVRLLRSSRQRSFQLVRENEICAASDSNCAITYDGAESVSYKCRTDRDFCFYIAKNFWTDFYISALPVRAGPEKIMM